jgi:hypothetical protein
VVGAELNHRVLMFFGQTQQSHRYLPPRTLKVSARWRAWRRRRAKSIPDCRKTASPFSGGKVVDQRRFRTRQADGPGDFALVVGAELNHRVQGFGSLAGVAKAKGEIYTGLPENGIAILNADNNDRQGC